MRSNQSRDCTVVGLRGWADDFLGRPPPVCRDCGCCESRDPRHRRQRDVRRMRRQPGWLHCDHPRDRPKRSRRACPEERASLRVGDGFRQCEPPHDQRNRRPYLRQLRRQPQRMRRTCGRQRRCDPLRARNLARRRTPLRHFVCRSCRRRRTLHCRRDREPRLRRLYWQSAWLRDDHPGGGLQRNHGARIRSRWQELVCRSVWRGSPWMDVNRRSRKSVPPRLRRPGRLYAHESGWCAQWSVSSRRNA